MYSIQLSMPFYAVANGNTVGIFTNWNDCKESVIGFKNAKYKKFDTREEAAAFIEDYGKPAAEPDQKERFDADYYVYTDGSCINNGKPDAKAGIGIYFDDDDPRNVSRCIDAAEKATNNVAELTAIIEAHSIIAADVAAGKRVEIMTDSEYAIKCLTGYGDKCSRKNWEQDIPNRELVRRAYELYREQPNIQFTHIMAHTENQDAHSIGNHHADRLANESIAEFLPKRMYVEVSYSDKDEVKEMGGRWDTQKRKWYIESTNPNCDLLVKKYT